MKKRTLEEFVTQRALRWRETQKEVLASHGANKKVAQFAHQEAKRKLSEAVDLAARRNKP